MKGEFAVDRQRLERAAAELGRSITAVPSEAQPYYQRVLHIAELAMAR
jgi:hypothetical protein